MSWLIPSVIATLSGTLLLAAVYFYLAYVDRKRFLKIWAMGWGIYGLRFIFLLVILASGKHPLLVITNQLAALVSGVFLLWGTYEFLEKRLPASWVILSVANGAWIVATILLNASFMVQTLPTFFFLGAIYIWTGLVFMRHLPVKGLGTKAVGISFVLWGLHKMDYPFLRPVQWFAPWGYLLASVLEISVALAMLLVYFQKTRQDLERSEQRFRNAFDYAHDGILLVEPTGRILQVNNRMCDLFGYSEEELLSMRISEISSPVDHEKTVEIMDRLNSGELDHLVFDKRYIDKRKKLIWGQVSSSVVRDQRGDPQFFVSHLRDMTQRREMEKDLFLAQFIIDHSPDAAFLIDSHARFLYVNQAACQWLEYSKDQLLSMGIHEVDPNLDQQAWEAHWREIKEEGGMTLESVLRSKSGQEFPVEVAVTLLEHEDGEFLCAFARDISERRLVEEEKQNLEVRLRQAQKMEAIGTLAGGIAHDFNNILGAILGFADLAREDAPKGSTMASDLDNVMKAGYKAKDLVKQILAFSRQVEVERIPIQPQVIIKEAVKMLRASVPTTIEIKQVLEQCGTILADPTQLHQVLMNLATNAYQAMEEKGGLLEIGLRKVELLREDYPHEPELHSGDYVELLVRDNGPGIDPTAQEKIFDPYFTTKEVGKGTGMGLAITHGIIKEYGGMITMASQPGQGTEFRVYLPMEETEAVQVGESLEEVPGGSERILFVDDEEFLVTMARNVLERLGYTVTTRTSGLEALELFMDQPNDFDLVITDQTMPGLTGGDLVQRILQIRPEVPIILCTGYSNIISEDKAKALGVKEFALKPLTKRDLAVLIRKVLDSA